jgi:hypothetical protein
MGVTPGVRQGMVAGVVLQIYNLQCALKNPIWVIFVNLEKSDG